jgi:glycosyltransferase involved in cell wall biosynthesis
VATPAEGSSVNGTLRAAGIPVVPIELHRTYTRPQADLKALRQLVRLLRSDRFALAHGHAAKAGALVRLAAAITGVPAVYTPHCFPFVGAMRREQRALAITAERLLHPISNAVVCVCAAERATALQAGVGHPDRLHVIHNGTPACPSISPDERLVEFAADGLLAACVTVLRPQKAVDTFIAAAPRVIRELPEARLAIVGEGPVRRQLEALAAARQVGDRLGFFGFLPPTARAIAAADVFVLPSAWEAFPIAALEALACGVPQVATDVGGVPEAVAHGETGFLCPPNDPASLAEAMLTLLRDSRLRAHMAERSRRRHREQFDVENMVARTAELYETVAK